MEDTWEAADHVWKCHTMTAFETDTFGYSTVVSLVHFETLRMGGFPYANAGNIPHIKMENLPRVGNEWIPEASDIAPLEAVCSPFLLHTYTGGDERHKGPRERRFKRWT